MWTLLLACAEPDPAKPIDTGTLPTTPTGACTAARSDALGPEPFLEGWHGELSWQDFGGGEAVLAGALLDGPEVGFHEEAERTGSCALLRFEAATCDPVCAGGELCLTSGCQRLPGRVGAGPLVVTGVVSEPLRVEPDGVDSYYGIAADAVAGDVLTVTSEGDEIPPFVATSCSVGAPAPEGDWSAQFAARPPGEEVTVRWANRNPEARVRIRMTTGVGTHGGIAHAEIACEAPDTGSLTFPGAYLDDLFSEGWGCGECGSFDLVRYRAGEIPGSGGALLVQAHAYFYFHP